MESDSLRILLDECVQTSVLRALTDDGHDVIRPPSAGGPRSLEDTPVLELVVAEGRVLVTTDTDFVPIYARWHGPSGSSPTPGIHVPSGAPDTAGAPWGPPNPSGTGLAVHSTAVSYMYQDTHQRCAYPLT